MNVFEAVARENEGWTGPAVSDGGREISYPELIGDVRRLAETLAESGIGPGSRTGITADDSYELIVCTLAVLARNAAAAPLSTRSPEEERKTMERESGLDFVLAEESFRTGAGEDFLRTPESFRRKFYLRRTGIRPEPVVLPDGRIPAFLRFSSGTTGTSKGVVLSHESVLERTDACAALEIGRGEPVLWVLDMAFHFVVTILLFLRRGAHIAVCGRPVESQLREGILEYRPVLLYATPYHYRLMTNSSEFGADDLKSVGRAFSTAMKLETVDAEKFREKFGLPLAQAYGIIEVGLPCVNLEVTPETEASVGRVQRAYDVRIFDPDPGTGTGEIGIRGPGMFDAYLKPFALRGKMCREGYFMTGDVGRVDGKGFLFLSGRSKNVINFAGMKIFPYEVEEILLGHPLVKECLVEGIAWPGAGEIPVAEIVAAGPLPEDWREILRRYCFQRLAPYKVPKEFRTVPELPRTASGKVIRRRKEG